MAIIRPPSVLTMKIVDASQTGESEVPELSSSRTEAAVARMLDQTKRHYVAMAERQLRQEREKLIDAASKVIAEFVSDVETEADPFGVMSDLVPVNAASAAKVSAYVCADRKTNARVFGTVAFDASASAAVGAAVYNDTNDMSEDAAVVASVAVGLYEVRAYVMMREEANDEFTPFSALNTKADVSVITDESTGILIIRIKKVGGDGEHSFTPSLEYDSANASVGWSSFGASSVELYAPTIYHQYVNGDPVPTSAFITPSTGGKLRTGVFNSTSWNAVTLDVGDETEIWSCIRVDENLLNTPISFRVTSSSAGHFAVDKRFLFTGGWVEAVSAG